MPGSRKRHCGCRVCAVCARLHSLLRNQGLDPRYTRALACFAELKAAQTLTLPSSGCSGSAIGTDGWAAVLAGMDGCTGLATINGVACAGLYSGGLEELRAAGGLDRGLTLGIVLYLSRSTATLRALDLRCVQGYKEDRGGQGVGESGGS